MDEDEIECYACAHVGSLEDFANPDEENQHCPECGSGEVGFPSI